MNGRRIHERTRASRKPQARSGMVLFVVYVIFYVGFVILTAFAPKVMAMDVCGVTLSILYGFGLILLAFVFAMIYMMICRGNARDDVRAMGSTAMTQMGEERA